MVVDSRCLAVRNSVTLASRLSSSFWKRCWAGLASARLSKGKGFGSVELAKTP